MTRHYLIKFIHLTFVLGIVLSACAPAPAAAPAAPATGGEAAAPASAEEVTLTLRVFNRTQEEVLAMQEALAKIFEQTGISVDLSADVPFDSYFDRFLTEAAAGVVPDLIELTNEQVAQLRQRDLVAKLEGIDPPLLSGAAIFDGVAYSVAWQYNCGGIGLAIASASPHYADALKLLSSLAVPVENPCPYASAGKEAWIPYPDTPSRAMIGDATLVPGDFAMRNAVRDLDALLAQAGVTVNVARAVVLGDEKSTTHLAPIWEGGNPKEQEDAVVGMAVIEGDTGDAKIPPGSYAVRYKQGKIELETLNQERIYPDFLGEKENPFGDPTAAIFKGSRDCTCCILGWCFSFRCG